MNDPGLDGAVADQAEALDQTERQGSSHEQTEQELDSQHPNVARWWFASTAYPLAAV